MSDSPLSLSDAVSRALAHTPARLLTGRAGTGYRTATALKLREDHAAAHDAVHAELEPEALRELGLFTVQTRAVSKTEHLMRPDLGRRLSDDARATLWGEFPPGADIQIVVGDGLSATAVMAQVPALLPLLERHAAERGWRFGRPFAVRYCRVGLMNEIGALLQPTVVVLLIGERPGLATAESLSAYLAYRPQPGHTDARRNLISNIHSHGIGTQEAAQRIVALAARMLQLRTSGVELKEEREGHLFAGSHSPTLLAPRSDPPPAPDP